MTMPDQSRFGRIPDASRRSGLSRAKLYQIAARHRGLFLKADGATIVDLQMLDQILARLRLPVVARPRPLRE